MTLGVVEALEWGLPVWSEIEFAWRHLEIPVAAITGTNGKTTVTEATSAMLEASGIDAPATGNIGSALSDHVDQDHEAVVVVPGGVGIDLGHHQRDGRVHPPGVGLVHHDGTGPDHQRRGYAEPGEQ